MGILPLEFPDGEDAASLGLAGDEEFTIPAVTSGQQEVTVSATGPGGNVVRFTARVRVDTPNEFDYYRHGGILHYVLRKLAPGDVND